METNHQRLELFLPGGMLIGDKLERCVRQKCITGFVEQRFVDAAKQDAPTPYIVSSLLSEAVETIGNQPFDKQRAAELCIADRQYLMQQLAIQLDGDHFWLQPHCQNCSARFDIGLTRSSLPLKPASMGFPFAKITLNGKQCTLRVPNGTDQEFVAEMEPIEAEQVLLMRCICDVSKKQPTKEFVERLTVEDIAKIEAALDEVAPDLGTRLEALCPECDCYQIVELNPYRINGLIGADLYEDVHTLAITYHWNEADVFALPRKRRHLYLQLIERNRGLHS